MVATADRVASGFEREEFEQYNASKDETRDGLDHFTARLLTLFEQIRIGGRPPSDSALRFRYPLKPLAPQIIFPVEATGSELREQEHAKSEYARLWDEFVTGLEAIPQSHRSNWPLWLDHFDSLWLAFTQAIPAATAFNIKPEVSLYDHSRATAALAVALWRWHQACGRTDDAAARAMRERTDYAEPKLLLVQDDFFGIQNFLFAAGGETRKQAAKLLRGRSFQVSLFTELAALRLLDELALPPTSQVLNAAGKFLIVAPNTDDMRKTLDRVRGEFDAWFLEHTFGMAGLGIVWEGASCSDFLKGRQGQPSPYSNLLERLHQSLECAKYRRFELCLRTPPPLPASFPYRVCEYNGRLPADRERSDEDVASCALSGDQVKIGEALARRTSSDCWCCGTRPRRSCTNGGIYVCSRSISSTMPWHSPLPKMPAANSASSPERGCCADAGIFQRRKARMSQASNRSGLATGAALSAVMCRASAPKIALHRAVATRTT